jgi:hypothetical protein
VPWHRKCNLNLAAVRTNKKRAGRPTLRDSDHIGVSRWSQVWFRPIPEGLTVMCPGANGGSCDHPCARRAAEDPTWAQAIPDGKQGPARDA